MLNGLVLKKPRVADANHSSNAEPDFVVLQRASEGGISDRTRYLTELRDEPAFERVEYCIQAQQTGDVVAPQTLITESPQALDSEGLTYSFNLEGYSLSNFSVLSVDNPATIDLEAGILTYNSLPSTPPEVSYTRDALQLRAFKNDSDISRFGYDSSQGRWSPLPGGPVEEIGELSGDPSQLLRLIEVLPTPSRIVIGSLGGVEVVWSYVSLQSDWDDLVAGVTQVPSGEARAFAETGEILFASNIQSAHKNQKIFQYRQAPFSREDSTGELGRTGEDLYLNPLPLAGEYPLLRVNYDTYLKVLRQGNTPDGDEQVSYDPSTGKITFLFSVVGGLPFYQDGISSLQNLEPFPGVSLGMITASRSGTSGIATFNVSDYPLEGVSIGSLEQGHVIPEIVLVEELSDLPRSARIPQTQAYAHVSSSGDVTLQLSFAWSKTYEGNTLRLFSRDFYLENGLSFRVLPNQNDLDNTKGLPDLYARSLVDDTLISRMGSGSFGMVPQAPLTNLGGLGDQVFYRTKRGPVSRVLNPNKDVVYDFDSLMLKWAVEVSDQITLTQTSSAVKLAHEVLVPDTTSLSLDLGSGPQPLVEGQDYVLKNDQGIVEFAALQGRILYEGQGSFTGQTLTFEEGFDFLTDIGVLPSNLDQAVRPVAILPDLELALRIESVSGNILTFPTTSPIRPDVFTSFRIVYEAEPALVYQWEDLNLPDASLTLTVLASLDTTNSVAAVESLKDLFMSEPFEVLEREVLGRLDAVTSLPSYYRNADRSFRLETETQNFTEISSGVPSLGEVLIDRTSGSVQFSTEDLTNIPHQEIVLIPELSMSLPSGSIEILKASGEIQIPTDKIGSDIEYSYTLEEDSYTYQESDQSLYISKGLSGGRRLVLTGASETSPVYFPQQFSLSALEGATQVVLPPEVVPQGSPVLKINGVPTPVLYNSNRNELVLSSPFESAKDYLLLYDALESRSGDKLGTLETPVSTPELTIPEGLSWTYPADLSSVLSVGDIVRFDETIVEVRTLQVSGGSTVIEWSSSILEDLSPGLVQKLNTPYSFQTVTSLPLLSRVVGSNQLHLEGEVLLQEGSLLKWNDSPNWIRSVQYDINLNQTVVEFVNRLAPEILNGESYEVSFDRVYDANPEVIEFARGVFLEEGFDVWIFEESGQGRLLSPGVDYQLSDAGILVLDPTQISLNPSQRLSVRYTGRDVLSPAYDPRSQSFIYPRFEVSYTRFASAEDAQVEGSSLEGFYRIPNPDTFYCRVLRLEDYALEVAESFGSNSIQSFNTDRPLSEQGSLTLQGEVSEALDRDRIGRFFLQESHEYIEAVEEYRQLVDGSVVGDKDGRFKFSISADDTPGGEDAITGELIPYFISQANDGSRPTSSELRTLEVSSQQSRVLNSIDDVIAVSKKPFSYTFPATFEFEGTFKKAWEPSVISRFYPESRRVIFRTPQDQDLDGTYEFFEDFGSLLGDLSVENVQAISNVKKAATQGWLISSEITVSGTQATLPVGMVYNTTSGQAENTGSGENLTEGVPERNLPPFAVDDIVSLGSVEYTLNVTTGILERSETIYAQNMRVVQVSGDFITLDLLDQNFLDTVFAGTLVTFADLDMVLTDPGSLLGNPPSAGYSGPLGGRVPDKDDTLFTSSLTTYRQGVDFGVSPGEGELINRGLPDFLARVTGQRSFEPDTLIEAEVFFKNSRLTPERFPALNGEILDDDGLSQAPYVYPISGAEVLQAGSEFEAFQEVRRTQEDVVVEISQTSPTGFASPIDFSLELTNPSEYDRMLVEGAQSIGSPGNSEHFRISEVSGNIIYLAKFLAKDPLISYTIDDAFTGTGTGTGSTWSDPGVDFTVLNGFTGSLLVGSTTYPIVSYQNGSVTVVGALPATGNYVIDVSSTTGEINNLHSFRDAGKDFSWVSNNDMEILTGVNADVYVAGQALGLDGVEVEGPLQIGGSSFYAALSQSPLVDRNSGQRDGTNLSRFNMPVGPPYSTDDLDLIIPVRNGSGVLLDSSRYEVITSGAGFVEVATSITESALEEASIVLRDKFYHRIEAAVVSTSSRVLHVPRSFGEDPPKVNDYIRISTGNNQRRYRIVSLDLEALPYAQLTVDRDFVVVEGDISNGDPLLDAFPIEAEIYRPRRFSEELDSLQNVLLQRRAFYEPNSTAETTPFDIQNLLVTGNIQPEHPQAPALPLLETTLENLLQKKVEVSDGVLVDLGGGAWALDSSTGDFVQNGVELGDYAHLGDLGYFLVSGVSSSRLELEDSSEFSYAFLPTLQTSSGLTFQVWSPGTLSPRAYEIFLLEKAMLKQVLLRIDSLLATTLHRFNVLRSSDSLRQHPANPLDSTLLLHETGSFSILPVGVLTRSDYLTGSAGLLEEFEDLLSGSENLYELRYAWIDFRINLENGTLPEIKRLKKEIETRLEKSKLTRLRSL